MPIIVIMEYTILKSRKNQKIVYVIWAAKLVSAASQKRVGHSKKVLRIYTNAQAASEHSQNALKTRIYFRKVCQASEIKLIIFPKIYLAARTQTFEEFLKAHSPKFMHLKNNNFCINSWFNECARFFWCSFVMEIAFFMLTRKSWN